VYRDPGAEQAGMAQSPAISVRGQPAFEQFASSVFVQSQAPAGLTTRCTANQGRPCFLTFAREESSCRSAEFGAALVA
jgi:hypothetical protein